MGISPVLARTFLGRADMHETRRSSSISRMPLPQVQVRFLDAASTSVRVVLVTPLDQLRLLGPDEQARYVADVVASVEREFPRALVEHRALGAVARRVELPELDVSTCDEDELLAGVLHARLAEIGEGAWLRATG